MCYDKEHGDHKNVDENSIPNILFSTEYILPIE